MDTAILNAVLWLLVASIFGYLISLLFSDWLQLSRRKFLLAYIPFSSAFLIAYGIRNPMDWLAVISRNWAWGLLAAALVSLFLISNVRSQPNSRQIDGGELAFDLAWTGLAYGLIDGLFLNVMPVLVVLNAFEWIGNPGVLARLGIGALAMIASLQVALAYHLGYREFRNRSVLLVLVGNGLITLAFLVSGNPLAAVLSHVIMHLTAVLQGAETTLQLPPHRQSVAGSNQ